MPGLLGEVGNDTQTTEENPQLATGADAQGADAPTATGLEIGDEGELTAELDAHLNSIPQEQQVFLAQYLTPELATVMGILLGPEGFEFFNNLADENVQLVPMDRAKVQEQLAGETGPGPASGAVVPPQQTNTPVTPPPAGPTSGPLA